MKQILDRMMEELRSKINSRRQNKFRVRDKQRSYSCNSIALQVKSKTLGKQKQQKTEVLIPYTSNLNSIRRVLLVDCPLDQRLVKEDIVSLSVSQLMALKEGSGRKLRKLLKTGTLVIPPDKAPIVLKNFGKLLQKYKRAPTVFPHKITELVLQQLRKKEFLRIHKNLCQTRIGPVDSAPEDLISKIKSVIALIKGQNLTIVGAFLKTTQGTPHEIPPKDYEQL